jgi:hypothetical protein
VADLDHLAREFEKVHDALPLLAERMAKTELWIELHPQMHRAEGQAVTIAQDALGKKMVELNDVRNRFVDKEEYRREHTHLLDDIAELRTTRDTSAGESVGKASFWTGTGRCL